MLLNQNTLYTVCSEPVNIQNNPSMTMVQYTKDQLRPIIVGIFVFLHQHQSVMDVPGNNIYI